MVHSDGNIALFEVSLIKRQIWPLSNVSQSVASHLMKLLVYCVNCLPMLCLLVIYIYKKAIFMLFVFCDNKNSLFSLIFSDSLFINCNFMLLDYFYYYIIYFFENILFIYLCFSVHCKVLRTIMM